MTISKRQFIVIKYDVKNQPPNQPTTTTIMLPYMHTQNIDFTCNKDDYNIVNTTLELASLNVCSLCILKED